MEDPEPTDRPPAITQEQELWGMALWLERQHGAAAPEYIAAQVERLARQGERAGIKMWKAVADRYDALQGLGSGHRDS